MSRICEYCGRSIPQGEDTCPHCGAPVLPSAGSGSAGVPQTIEELKAFAARHNLPLADMRFFLGENYPDPRAFGIYEDEYGQFIVYKNKADGTRAIRYQGPDEAHAVHEIYLKMKEEIRNQRRMKSQAAAPRSSSGSARSGLQKELNLLKAFFTLVIIVVLVLNLKSCIDRSPKQGYYHYGNDYYYSQGSDWYVYDSGSYGWIPTTVDDDLSDHSDQYYESPYYSSDYGTGSFADSPYYDYDYDDDDDDWDWDDDSDWDWDSDDSWDSGSTDWDSDW